MKWSITGLLVLLIGACSQGTEQQTSEREDKEYNLVEIVRLQAHFAAVEYELLHADASHLTPAQRSRRDARIRDLREYVEASVFPHNHHVPSMSPVFVDEHGTRCAVAHLIEASGDSELMKSVAERRNLGYVRELVSEPALVAWLDHNGLSPYEAAMIQPAYPCGSLSGDCTERAVSPTQVVLSTSATALGALSIGLNWSPGSSRGAKGLFGVVAGAFGTVMGLGYATHGAATDNSKRLGQANIGIGVVAGLLGLHRLFTPQNAGPSKPVRQPSGAPGNWSLRPTFHPGGAGVKLGRAF